MKKLGILFVLALELAVCGCGNTTPTSTTTTTSANSNWEANLIDGKGQASLLNFVVGFSVSQSGPLTVTGISFFNAGACFATGSNAENVAGTATLITGSTDTVTGTLTMTVTSTTNGSVLTLGTSQNPATLTGTSNGTTTTTGTLSNGVVVGSWSLTPGSSTTGCNSGGGTFVMCQGAATCSTTPVAADRL